jgi:hypothetical protein
VSYDFVWPCQRGETHAPRPPENLLPIGAKCGNLIRTQMDA